jgi:hypothetical protein|tara:strand:- start:2896 stop:3279 length:384 start_codon:yes stop_codon:yes gene_type:complete
MKKQLIKEKYEKYGLTPDDIFKHQHYLIITRSGIEKIQAIENIKIYYDVIKCEKDFAGVKATATKEGNTLETFGSALKGDFKSGNTMSWYVLEMAEKRAMSRAVLKMTGFYELGVFGEDEAEDFKRN